MFQSLVNTLLLFEYPETRVFGRSGKDAGQDARSLDGKTVYQYKYHTHATTSKIISDANGELLKIAKYRRPSDDRHVHWQHAVEWVLVSNVVVNPNDMLRWDKEIVPEFSKIGIKANLWGVEELQKLLTMHSHVAEAYFEGQNRSFLSLGEAYEYTNADELGESGLKVSLVGRDSELAEIDAFLKAGEKVICVHGPGGVGKSRLLLEIGSAAEKANWQVLWGIEASLAKNGQWFSAILYTRPTLLLLDEPQDSDLVRVIAEQLRAPNSQMKGWKVIIAVRSPNDPVLKAVTTMPENIRQKPMVLAALTKEQSKILALELINASALSALPGERKVAFAEHLSRLGDRFPIWIAMAVNVLAKSGDISQFPASIKDVATKYLDEVIERGGARIAEPRQIEQLLRWLALYEELDIEDATVVEFVSNHAGFADKTIFHECLNSLVTRKFVIRKGINGRIYSIKPDVMREFVVRNWLTQETGSSREATEAAKQLVQLMVRGEEDKPLPRILTLIRALAKAEYSSNLEGSRVDLLSPLVSELKRTATEGPVLEQQVIIKFISSFDFARPLDALEIIRAIRTTDKPPVEYRDIFGETRTITHQNVVAGLAWPLFNTARHVFDESGRKAIFKEMVALSLFEDKNPALLPNDGRRADSLIKRMIAGENDEYIGFDIEAFGMAMELLDELVRVDAVEEAVLNLTEVLCEPFLSIEKERTFHQQHSMTVRRTCFRLGSPEGVRRSEMRTALRQCASAETAKTRLIAWKLLSFAVSAANRVRIEPKNGGDASFFEELKNDIIGDMTWVVEALKVMPLSLSELKAARGVWKWHYRFGKDEEVKALAQQCEAFYQKHPLVSAFHIFFSDEMYEQVPQKAAEVGGVLGKAGTTAEILNFVTQAEEFGSERTNWSNILQVAQHLSTYWNTNNQIEDFVTDALEKNYTGLAFLFATKVLSQRLMALRSENAFGAISSLLINSIQAISSPIGKKTLILELYARPHPLNTGVLTEADLAFVRDQMATIADVFEPWLKCRILVSMHYCDWTACKLTCTEILANTPDVDKINCFLATLEGMRFLDLFRADYPQIGIHIQHWNWLLEMMVSLPDMDKIDDNAQWELDQLVGRFGRKDINWLLDTIERRIEALGSRAPDGNHSFKIVPMRHRLTKYVTPVQVVDAVPGAVRDAIGRLLNYNERKDTLGYVLPEYAVEIDPSGLIVPELAETRISALTTVSKDALWPFSRFAGHYGFNSQPWRKIAKAAILAAENFSQRDKASIYLTFLPQGMESSNYPAAEMDPLPERKLKTRKTELQEESDTTFLPFRNWHLAAAQSEFDQTVAHFKEQSEL
jgi:hypothetical protein